MSSAEDQAKSGVQYATNADFSFQERVKQHEASFVVPECATIVGTGAFGAWVAIFLAKAGVPKLVLINATGEDTKRKGRTEDVEGRELAVGPFLDSHLGMAKVDALEEMVLSMRPDICVEKHKVVFVPRDHSHLLYGTVFAGVSDIDVLKGIFRESKRRGLRCFGGSYFANVASTFTDVPADLVIESDAPCWVGSTATSALLAVNSALMQQINFCQNISTLGVGSANILRNSVGDI